MRMDSKGPAANTFRMDKSLTCTLAEYAASTSIEKIPADVRELAKRVILDEMASAHLGRRSLAGGLAVDMVAAKGARPSVGTGLELRLRLPRAAVGADALRDVTGNGARLRLFFDSLF